MSQPKKKLSQTDLLPYSAGETVALIALERIDTAPQVRTEFDDESIAELAKDIKARGVMQPIIVRQKEEGRFLIVAGERRYRAAQVAELKAIPALIRDLDDNSALDMQLAENIQREDLSLSETAGAIRTLYNREKNLGKVAELVNKSKPWVSKHLALTLEGFSWQAKALLEKGATEDMEILNLVNKAEKEFGWHAANIMAEQIDRGEMNRQKARQFVKDWKADLEHDEELQRQKEEQQNEEASTNEIQNTKERTREAWEIMEEIEERLATMKENRTVLDIDKAMESVTEKDREAIAEEVKETYEEGKRAGQYSSSSQAARALLKIKTWDAWARAAAITGYMGDELTAVNLVMEIWEDATQS